MTVPPGPEQPSDPDSSASRAAALEPPAQLSPIPRRRRVALLASIVTGVVAAGLLAVLATRSTAPGALATSELGGKVAPAISGRSLVRGEEVSLAGLIGKRRYVLVDFFASWCVPCQQEMSQLEALNFYERGRVGVLGVDIDDSAANGRVFLRRYGASWPAIEDSSGAGSAAVAYGVSGPPELFLISPEGRVVAYFVGAPTYRQIEGALSAARAHARVHAQHRSRK